LQQIELSLVPAILHIQH